MKIDEVKLSYNQIHDIAKAIYLDISDYVESNSHEYALFLKLNSFDK